MNDVVVATRKAGRKAKGSGHLLRAEILEAAERIFAAEGYDGATIRKIANEVGVSSTALYMHFPDKAQILMEISGRAYVEFVNTKAEIAERPLGAVTRLRMMTEAYMKWGFAHPHAYQLILCDRQQELAKPKQVLEASSRARKIFLDVLQEVAEAGQLRVGDPNLAAQSIWLACHGVVAMLTAGGQIPWAPAEDLMRVTLDGMLHGLVID